MGSPLGLAVRKGCLVPCPVPGDSGCKAVPGGGCASGAEQGHGCLQLCCAGGPQVCLLLTGVSCAPEQGQSLAVRPHAIWRQLASHHSAVT